MRLLTFENKDKVGMHVAEHVVRRINEFQPTKERPFVIGLPTGSSPIPTYKHLIAMYQSGHVSFKHVVSFNMDEYAGLPRSHPESYHSFMWTTASRGRDGFRETLAGRTIVTDAPGRWTNFLGHVDIDPANVHILDGNAPDLEAECAAYEASIEKFGGIELFLAGIGPDGHIALDGVLRLQRAGKQPRLANARRRARASFGVSFVFFFPRRLRQAYDTIVANSRFFDNDLSKVPTKALTVGVATVMDAKEVLIIITGISKSLALRNCIEEPLSHMWTASAIQLHDKGVIVCDEDATMELRVKTVRYFDKLQKSPQGLYADLGVGVVP
ncbi:glucosamine-6-phosphate deaminase [Aureococcus anophagefferens]|nr:glucosamine-6-phosphate deaminase [Aureococcus anophagefferens]